MWGGAWGGVGDMFGSRICFIGFFFFGGTKYLSFCHI